jgi:hypothetical protein
LRLLLGRQGAELQDGRLDLLPLLRAGGQGIPEPYFAVRQVMRGEQRQHGLVEVGRPLALGFGLEI